ncbi:transcriptional regulator WhiB-like [Mycobacterium phage Rey]|uniref:4Fe-4S Wbl-type domain-containing protein n=1 Tax=Mycobacterium phage Rey TaxID=1034115 RepID=G1D5D9_9CAUD|nr:transcriptional regulator WhiB-like [Mycobacterium phage Rey]AEK09989.1 hypothetical protein PBI_REY_77 [Mycobacterium phage Rey]
MSKLWQKADEWTEHAPCAERIEFIISPDELGPDRTAAVKATCAACPVRPECIKLNVQPLPVFDKPRIKLASHAMWVAGEWLPDLTKQTSEELEAKRQQLIDSLPMEEARRPYSMR